LRDGNGLYCLRCHFLWRVDLDTKTGDLAVRHDEFRDARRRLNELIPDADTELALQQLRVVWICRRMRCNASALDEPLQPERANDALRKLLSLGRAGHDRARQDENVAHLRRLYLRERPSHDKPVPKVDLAHAAGMSERNVTRYLEPLGGYKAFQRQMEAQAKAP
jgi:hypothetical protein